MKYLSALLLAVFILGCSAGASESEPRNTPTDDPAVAELQNKVDSLENLVAGQLTTIRDLTIRLEAVELNDGVTPVKYAEGYINWDNSSYPSSEYKVTGDFAQKVATKLGITTNPNAQYEIISENAPVGEQTIVTLRFINNWASTYTISTSRLVYPTRHAALFEEEILNRFGSLADAATGNMSVDSYFYVQVPE